MPRTGRLGKPRRRKLRRRAPRYVYGCRKGCVHLLHLSSHDKPVGEHVVWVCRTLSCELRGAAAVQKSLEARFGCSAGETSADGKFTLKTAECLAGCGYAPVVQVDERYFEGLTPAETCALMDRIEKGEEPTYIDSTTSTDADDFSDNVDTLPGAYVPEHDYKAEPEGPKK